MQPIKARDDKRSPFVESVAACSCAVQHTCLGRIPCSSHCASPPRASAQARTDSTPTVQAVPRGLMRTNACYPWRQFKISSAHVIGCLRDICAAWHQTVAVVLTCVVMLNTASVPEQRCVGVRLTPGASSTPVISRKLHARATHARNVTATTCGHYTSRDTITA